MLGDSIRRRRGGAGAGGARRRGRSKSGARWGRWLLIGLALALTGFGAGYGVTVLMMFPTPPESGDTVVLPDIAGLTLEEVERELDARGLALGRVLELPHPREPAGRAIGQAPVPGQRIAAGGEVEVAISTGPARVYVPDLLGLPADRAEQMARRIGFDVEHRSEAAAVEPGQVIRVEPTAGTEVELPGTVVLVSSSGLPFRPDTDTADAPPAAPEAPPPDEPPAEPPAAPPPAEPPGSAPR